MSSESGERRTRAPEDPLELRATPRVGADHPVEIHSSEFGGGLRGRTRDLSVGGACVATPSPFGFKSVHTLVLDLPEGPTAVDVVGCWQREEPAEDLVLTGFQFENLAEQALERIWSQVLDAGKSLARFLYERSDLHELGLEEAMGLAQVSRFREIAAGQTIYRQGQRSRETDGLFLVQRGQVCLQVRVRDAIETPIAQLGPGELFGGLPLLCDQPHCESAIADTDCLLLEIDESAFRYLRSAKPWLGHRLGSAILRVSATRLHAILGAARDRL